MKLYVSNAFSLQMLQRFSQGGTPNGYTPNAKDTIGTARLPRPISLEEAKATIADYKEHNFDVVSIVGHADTAMLFTNVLGTEITFNRATVKLEQNQALLVGQYVGPRLPEGVTTLPEGSVIEWWLI